MKTTQILRMVALVAFYVVSSTSLLAQRVGDKVRLQSSNQAGVPVHPALADASYFRWPNGSEGIVLAIDAPSGWHEIDANGQKGWVVKSYLTVVSTTDDGEETTEGLAYRVGTWNLEWFKDGKPRGFPENTYTPAGPSYGERTTADYQNIADIIRVRLAAKILVLTEINRNQSGQSDELDRLIGKLGASWKYRIGAAGNGQHVAMIYDSRVIREDNWIEIAVPQEMMGGSDVFARDPVVAKFTLLDGSGTARNDIVIVGLHLASGQSLIANHNKAMTILKEKLRGLVTNGSIPAGERDVLIMGDFNASRYDLQKEDFWEDYDAQAYKFQTLSPPNADGYPGTRLAGVPLFPKSQIDYILGSNMTGGMFDQLVQFTAHVHTELLTSDFNEFRRHASDHLPVTVQIKVVADDD